MSTRLRLTRLGCAMIALDLGLAALNIGLAVFGADGWINVGAAAIILLFAAMVAAQSRRTWYVQQDINRMRERWLS